MLSWLTPLKVMTCTPDGILLFIFTPLHYQLSKIEWPYHNSHRLGNALCPLIHRHCTQLSQFSSVCGSPKEDRNHVYIFSESSTMHFKWFNSNYSPYNPFQENLLNTALDCRTFTRFHTRNHVLLIYFTSDILV